MYTIEVIASKESLYSHIDKAIEALNGVQTEFIFHTIINRLKPEGYLLDHSEYKTKDLFQWMRDFTARNKGKRDFMILVVDVPIEGEMYTNLFGNVDSDDKLAIFTTSRFHQFVQDQRRYCMYYLVRYALSCLAPEIRSHKTTGCMFDNKIKKRDLLLSLNSGNICNYCKTKLQPHLTPEIKEALDKMLQLVSALYPFALIMKGGGVKGLAYAGALEILENYFAFDVFAGTSAGAIAAVLLGAEYTPTELKDFFEKTEFSTFKDADFAIGIFNSIFKNGWYPGRVLEDTIEQLIFEKTKRQRIPMCDLPNRTILYATQKSVGTITFDSEGERRETVASFAARCSMSIPRFFIPPRIDNRRVYDGGIKNNFPTYRFKSKNPKKPFIGLYLYTPPKNRQGDILDVLDVITESEDYEIYKDHKDRIVLINTGPISMTDFNLTKEKKDFLLVSGKLSAVEFIRMNYPDFDTSMYDIKSLTNEFKDKLQQVENPGWTL